MAFYGLIRRGSGFADGAPTEIWIATSDHEDTLKGEDDFLFAMSFEEAAGRLAEKYPCPRLDGVNISRISRPNSYEFVVYRLPAIHGDLTKETVSIIEAYLTANPTELIGVSFVKRRWGRTLPLAYYDSKVLVASPHPYLAGAKVLRYDPSRARARHTADVNAWKRNEAERIKEKERQHNRRLHEEARQACIAAISRPWRVLRIYAGAVIRGTPSLACCRLPAVFDSDAYGFNPEDYAAALELVEALLRHHDRRSKIATVAREKLLVFSKRAIEWRKQFPDAAERLLAYEAIAHQGASTDLRKNCDRLERTARRIYRKFKQAQRRAHAAAAP